MKTSRTGLILSLGLLAGGCALFRGDGEQSVSEKPTSPAPPVEGANLQALADSTLPKGECGMVLWTLDEEAPAPVFRYISGEQGEIVVNGQTVALRRVEADGVSAFGISEDQKFVADSGLTANVSVRFSLGFDGGTYLQRGLITVVAANGWRTIAPAAGIAGCRSK